MEAEKHRVQGVPVGPLCLLLGRMGARARAGDETRASGGDGEDSNYGHSHVHPRHHHKNNNDNSNNHSGNNNNEHHKDEGERVVLGHDMRTTDGLRVTRGGHLAGNPYIYNMMLD